jgi:hypothetical protein
MAVKVDVLVELLTHIAVASIASATLAKRRLVQWSRWSAALAARLCCDA